MKTVSMAMIGLAVLFAMSCGRGVKNIQADILVKYISDGDAASVERYLNQSDRDLDAELYIGMTLLAHAVEVGQVDIVESIVNHGGSPFISSNYTIQMGGKKLIPLEIASRLGRVEIVQYFLEHPSSSRYIPSQIHSSRKLAGYCSDTTRGAAVIAILDAFQQ